MLYLKADYSDREKLSTLGAKWNFEKWAWEIPRERYADFSPWLNGKTIVTGALYIASGRIQCPYCGKHAKPAILLLGDYIKDGVLYSDPRILSAVSDFTRLPNRLTKLLFENFSIGKGFDLNISRTRVANFCPSCKELFHDRYLFEEAGAPFNFSNGKKRTLYTVFREGDALLDCDFAREVELSAVLKNVNIKKASSLYLFGDDLF